MPDLERQLRSYAETLDRAAPPVEELAATRPAGRAAHRSRPVWAFAAAAAVVVVVVGSIAVLTGLRAPTDDVASTSIPAVSTTTAPVDDSTIPGDIAPSEYVTLVSDTPAYSGGEGGDVGGRPRVAAGPVVIDDDGMYHVVFAAGGEDDVWEAVFHGTSPDGSAWEIDDTPVVFDAVQGASDLYIGSLHRLDDGSWAMYYHVAFDTGGHGNHVFVYSIGRATAPVPEGPWVADSEPMILPGTDAQWDAGAVRYPTIVRQGGSWLMYYTGYGAKDDTGDGGPGAMGLATSRDGATWEKLADPVFVGDPRRPWEDGGISRIDTVWTGAEYVLLYSGRTGGSRGLATSADGFTWARVDDAPVLTGFDVPRPAIFSTSLLVDDDRIRLYVSNGGHRTTTSVYEMELRLPPDSGG